MLAINIESVTCCADTYAPGAPPPACRTHQRRRAACPGQGTTARGRTRASRGRAISTAYRGTPGHLDDAYRLDDPNPNQVTWMTRLVLPAMLAKKQGAVVNMSSASVRAWSGLGLGRGRAQP